jgi:integrase
MPREGDVERGIPIDPKVGLVTFHEAAEDMLNDYKANRKRTYVDAKRRINKHLAPFFGNKRLSSITASDIRAYIAKRMADTYLARPARRIRHRNRTLQEPPEIRRPVSAGEINRELTVLKRMFSLAIEAGSCITSLTSPCFARTTFALASSSTSSTRPFLHTCQRVCGRP